MIDLDANPPVSWPRAALSAIGDIIILAFGLAGLVALVVIGAAVMGKL
jgi:hypothetical protein